MFCGPNLVFEAKDVSTCSLHTAGAMALICNGVDRNTINIIVCWRSDDILRYQNVQEEPIMSNFSQLMLTHGKYYFLPQQEVSCF